MKNSKINQFLRREGAKLPPEMYVAYPKEEIEIPIHIDGEDTGKTRTQLMKIPTEYPVNHGRRLWRIWKRTKSLEAINQYLLLRGMQLMYAGKE